MIVRAVIPPRISRPAEQHVSCSCSIPGRRRKKAGTRVAGLRLLIALFVRSYQPQQGAGAGAQQGCGAGQQSSCRKHRNRPLRKQRRGWWQGAQHGSGTQQGSGTEQQTGAGAQQTGTGSQQDSGQQHRLLKQPNRPASAFCGARTPLRTVTAKIERTLRI